jgi:beta-D-xylosidase 4
MSPGCDLNSNSTNGFAAAIAAATAADFVVLALGIDGSIEGEGHDRKAIDLPGQQHALAAAIAAVGKPTAVILINGGMMDVSAEAANPAIGAILETGYAGFLGGTVIAQTLLGQNDHLGGKLATTWYPADYVNQIVMSEMELDVGVGRGYRFYAGPVVFPFGYGLAYTSFSVLPQSAPPAHATLATEGSYAAGASRLMSYSVNVTNTGSVTGDEVVQGYFSPDYVPLHPTSRLIRQLFGYQRVHLAPGESAVVSFDVSSETLRMADKASGDLVSTPGTFGISLTNGAGAEVRHTLVVTGEEVVAVPFPAF